MPKNDYTVVVFFEKQKPKKWTYVHKLYSFASFLNGKHSDWTYMNIYERRTRKFIKRIKKGEYIPQFITQP